MNSQSSDTLVLNGIEYSISSLPMEQYWVQENYGPDFFQKDPGYWPGYKAKWTIIENKLFLIDFSGVHDYGGGEISMQDVFRDSKKEVFASWYNDFLFINQGEIIYSDLNWSLYEKILCLKIENGIITSQHIIHNTPVEAIAEYKKGNYQNALEIFNQLLDTSFKNFEVDMYDVYERMISKYILINFKIHSLGYDLPNLDIKKQDNENWEVKEFSAIVSTLTSFDMSDKIQWGRHKGRLISDIMRIDPTYILWCIFNLVNFCIDNVVFFIKDIRMDSNFIDALEINYCKNEYLKSEELKRLGRIRYEKEQELKGDFEDFVSGPQAYGYKSWDEMTFYEGFGGDRDAWENYNT